MRFSFRLRTSFAAAGIVAIALLFGAAPVARAAATGLIVSQATDGSVFVTFSSPGGLQCASMGSPATSINGSRIEISTFLATAEACYIPSTPPPPYSYPINVGHLPDGSYAVEWSVAESCPPHPVCSTGFPVSSAQFTLSGGRLPGTPSITNAAPYTTISGSTPGGAVVLSMTAPAAPCGFLSTEFRDPGPGQPVPPPYGTFAFRAGGCGVPGSMGEATFTLDLAQPPAANLVLWKYGPTADNVFGHWYTIPATVSGTTVTFSIVDGGLGDDDLVANGEIQSYGALYVGGVAQDMWYGGPTENGWGLSLAQHGAGLFGVLFTYDANGKPTWLALQGAWDGPYTSYTGALYRPHGSPYYAYDAARVSSGPPVGTMTITFSDLDHATLDYVIDGVHGQKSITRQPFGGGTAPAGLGDMYWGGRDQNGWGIAVMQHEGALFNVWFTYDANGVPTWFVMPGGTWNDDASNTYSGRVYTTTGSPWLGVPYDASKLRATDVGSYALHFDDPAGSFEYAIQGHQGTMAIVRQPF